MCIWFNIKTKKNNYNAYYNCVLLKKYWFFFIKKNYGYNFIQIILHDIKNNIYIINDSKSTNLLNTSHCIKNFANKGKIGWIGGGKEQMQDVSKLDDSLQHISYAALTGSSANILANHLEIKSIKYEIFDKLLDCIKWLRANDCNIIIFSPGYASTDQYKNFEERGTHFNKIIQELYV